MLGVHALQPEFDPGKHTRSAKSSDVHLQSYHWQDKIKWKAEIGESDRNF